jgi:predicted nucleic acid-binding protein
VIVPDTSIWVAALRRPGSGETHTLKALLDADAVALPLPVRVELLSGVSARDRVALTRALRGLPVVVPDEEAWAQIERWTTSAARAGSRFSVTDLLIAASAQAVDALLWSTDTDFERMESLGMIQRYLP